MLQLRILTNNFKIQKDEMHIVLNIVTVLLIKRNILYVL